MGGSPTSGHGSFDYQGVPILGQGTDRHQLADHSAVGSHGDGTSTVELADFIRVLTEAAISRVQGVGADQYDKNGLQKFETMSMDELLDELLDEVYDCQSYLAMLALKVIALRERAR